MLAGAALPNVVLPDERFVLGLKLLAGLTLLCRLGYALSSTRFASIAVYFTAFFAAFLPGLIFFAASVAVRCS